MSWRYFLGSFAVTLAVVAALGYAISSAFVSSPPKRLMTPVFQFDLLDGWACDQQGTEWVCSPPGEKAASVAVIAMKYRGPEDTLENYADHLKKPVELKRPDGSAKVSQVKHVGIRPIGGYEWAEGLHYESEIPGYYAHYLGTVTSNVGIVVTFSAHQSVYDELNTELETVIGSLQVYQRLPGASGQ
jgi:hypothetical protein